MVRKDLSNKIAAKAEEKTKIAESEEEEASLEMEKGNINKDVYSEEGLENLEESDEIKPSEEGFMEGESHEGIRGKCATCGKALINVEEVIERKKAGKRLYFCSESCEKRYKPLKWEE